MMFSICKSHVLATSHRCNHIQSANCRVNQRCSCVPCIFQLLLFVLLAAYNFSPFFFTCCQLSIFPYSSWYRKLPCLCPLTPHKDSIDFPFLFIHYPIFFARGCLIVTAVHGGNQAALNWSLRLAIASQHLSHHIRTA